MSYIVEKLKGNISLIKWKSVPAFYCSVTINWYTYHILSFIWVHLYKQKLMQILRLNDFEKIGKIIVTYQYIFLLCKYHVNNTLMLVHQRIVHVIVQILCMWLITIIAFDYYTTLLQISLYISWASNSVVKVTTTFPL